jgi:hypothetical protein
VRPYLPPVTEGKSTQLSRVSQAQYCSLLLQTNTDIAKSMDSSPPLHHADNFVPNIANVLCHALPSPALALCGSFSRTRTPYWRRQHMNGLFDTLTCLFCPSLSESSRGGLSPGLRAAKSSFLACCLAFCSSKSPQSVKSFSRKALRFVLSSRRLPRS